MGGGNDAMVKAQTTVETFSQAKYTGLWRNKSLCCGSMKELEPTWHDIDGDAHGRYPRKIYAFWNL